MVFSSGDIKTVTDREERSASSFAVPACPVQAVLSGGLPSARR